MEQLDVEDKRVPYLDAIRGLGAIQVVLLHFSSALIPALVFCTPSNLSFCRYFHFSLLPFFLDGHSAVVLFFILSGYVLTGAFGGSSKGVGLSMLSRLVRLGIPGFASCWFSASLFLLFGELNVEVGHITGSDWFSGLWHPQLSVAAIFRDGLVNALVTGYQGMDPLGGVFHSYAQPSYESFNIPLWTISVEVYGSLVVILSCSLKRRLVIIHWSVLIAVFSIYVSRTFYMCFIFGHLLAINRLAEKAPIVPQAIALVLFGCGAWLCVEVDLLIIPAVKVIADLKSPLLFESSSAFDLQKIIGSSFIFLGIIQSVVFRRMLSNRYLIIFGRLSFPIYLVHFPILFGLGSFCFIAAFPILGTPGAVVLTIIAGLISTYACAVLFAPIDAFAIALSNRVRRKGPDAFRKIGGYSDP